jgi:hypothetical protein
MRFCNRLLVVHLCLRLGGLCSSRFVLLYEDFRHPLLLFVFFGDNVLELCSLVVCDAFVVVWYVDANIFLMFWRFSLNVGFNSGSLYSTLSVDWHISGQILRKIH